MTNNSPRGGHGLGTLTIVASVALVGCLQDYDQFDFGAGGAPTTSTDASTGSSSGSFGSTANSSGSTANSTAASTASSTAGSTAGSTAASTATSSSSSGGGVLVACFGDTCDVSAGEVCCVQNAAMGGCQQGSCGGSDIPITCDEQADCPGEVCCVNKNGANIDDVSCSFNCIGQDEDLICSATDPCPSMDGVCQPNADLPSPYQNCD